MYKPIKNICKLFSGGRRIALLVLAAGLGTVQAQNISNYVFSTNTSGTLDPMVGATTTAGTGNMVAGYNDDRNTGLFPIGFPFTFMGVKYTHFSANSNGQMRLHRSSTETAIGTANITTLTSGAVTFAPVAGDNSVNAALRFVVTGTAPNRIFKLEFPGFAIPYSNTAPSGDMQVWLSENGKIEYIYGSMECNAAGNRSIFLSSSNTATTNQTVTLSSSPTSTATATLVANALPVGQIVGLYSAAQGSRRVLAFTPAFPVNGIPGALNTTAVTSTSLTLNWTDNSTNESWYTVEQSIDGGLNYTTLATLAANTIQYNVTGLIPSKSYTFRVTAAAEADIDKSSTLVANTLPANAVVSTTSGGDWTSTTTWANGVVPTATDSVVILDGASVVINGTTPTCFALRVGTGSSGNVSYSATTASTLTVVGNLYVSSGAIFDAGVGTLTTHNLRMGGTTAGAIGEGSIVVNGTMDLNTTAGVTATFFGSLSAKITGTPLLLDFRSVTLNKGTVSINRPMLEIEVPFTVQGANTVGLIGTHTAGLLKINGTFTQSNPLYTTAGYTIPLNGGLHINNPNFTVASTSGSPTVNGLLQVTQGIYNVSQTNAQVLGFGTGSTFTVDGGTVNAAARITTGNVMAFNFSSGAINVAIVGNSTSASPSFGITSATSVVNWTGGTLTLMQRSTGATQQDYNVAPVAGFNGGTLKIGDAATATNFDFNIRGNVPNVVFDNTTNAKSVVLGAQLNVWNSLTVPTGSTLSLNGFVLYNVSPLITNDGTVNGTTAGSNLVFAGTVAQTYAGTGTDTHQAISNQNTVGGVTFNKPMVAYRANFFSTTSFINSNNITLGNGNTQAVIIQIGVAGFATGNVGIFDVAPLFNLGTGTYSVIYQQEGAMRTSGIEIPAGRSVLNLTIANTNNVTLTGGALDITGTLTLTAGKLITTTTNLPKVTATGTATVGSATSYVDGPLQRSIPASLVAAGTISFPVGKSNTYSLVELVNSGTNAGGAVDVLVERFNTATGGTAAIGQLNSLYNNGYWAVAIQGGAFNLDSTYIRVNSTGLTGINRLAYSSLLTGSYTPVSNAPIGNTLTTGKITSAPQLEGFYAVGEVITPISGSFLIGASKTAPNYTTITAALADLATKQVQGNVEFLLDADYNSTLETFPISFNPFQASNPAFTVTVKPNTGVSANITASNATTIFRFANGASNYIIDGSNNGTTTQHLFISNTNTSGAVVMFQGTAANQGVNNTILKNTIIKAGSSTGGYGILIGGTAVSLSSAGYGHAGLLIENNVVYNADYGIVVSGNSTSNKVKQVTLLNNKIGSDSSAFFPRSYGVYLINADSILVEGNAIFNLKQAGALNNAGIWLSTGVTNSTIKKNSIRGIHSTSANGYGAYGINVESGAGMDNDSIYNNLIYDIKTANYSTTSTTWNAYGIRLANGANNLKIYHNTIHLFGAPQNGTNASASAPLLILTGTYAGVDIRNNIFSNTTTGLAGSKHYAYWTTVAGAISGVTFNNNNYFVGGAYGILMNANGTDVATLNGLQASTVANANSISVNPSFVNDTTLLPGLGTVTGAGAAIATITRDIIGATRSATTPTIGAYENAVDLSGPAISYTNIQNTAVLTNTTLTNFAVITDPSGVDVTTHKPRIYFKRVADANTLGNYPSDNSASFNGWKYVEATNTTSPFSFTIDYSLLYLTGAVVVGDVIEYFVTAQDLVATPNVSANPSTGFAATGVASITSVPTTRNIYNIVTSPLNGVYLVGAAQVSPNYVSITQAVNDLNLRGVSGPVTFELTDASYTAATETFPIVFNQFVGMGASNPIVIKPTSNATVAITGSSAQAIFRFNGADYISINGDATGNATRDLTVTNTSNAANSAVIWLVSQAAGDGAKGISIKNSKIEGTTAALATTFGIYAAGSAISTTGTGADNDSLLVENNLFTKLGIALYASGTSTNKNKGTTIVKNSIGDVVTANTVNSIGIYIMQTNGVNISGNLLKNINGTGTAIGDGMVGVLLMAGVENAVVSKNVIDSVIYAGTGGYGGKGIDVSTGNANSNIIISNNMVSNIMGDGWNALEGDGIVGIRILGTTGGVKILHNTVYLRGDNNRAATATLSAAVYAQGGVTNLEAKNNIFINGIVNTLNTGSKAYSIASAITNPATVNINYNNYFAFGSQAVFGFLGADVTSLTNWKATLVQDANSVTDSTSFVALSDLHLTGASIGNPIYTCVLIPTITDDIDGHTRPSFTYMGADDVLNIPVPVKWVSFDGVKTNNNAKLNWVTASESNNKGFEVERSFDGRSFSFAGFVKGAGNSNIQLSYVFTDVNVFAAGVSKVYYRLKQVDFDGKYNYSTVVVLFNNTANATAISAYPNPFNTDVNVNLQATKSTTAVIAVFDISGRNLVETSYQVVEGNNNLLISDLANLNAGIYFVKIQVEGQENVIKMVKN